MEESWAKTRWNEPSNLLFKSVCVYAFWGLRRKEVLGALKVGGNFCNLSHFLLTQEEKLICYQMFSWNVLEWFGMVKDLWVWNQGWFFFSCFCWSIWGPHKVTHLQALLKAGSTGSHHLITWISRYLVVKPHAVAEICNCVFSENDIFFLISFLK